MSNGRRGNLSRTASGMTGGSARKMGGHVKTATGVWTRIVHDDELFADEQLPRTAECCLRGCGTFSCGSYTDTLWRFACSGGGRLTGDCWLPLAVGGEQHGATSPSRAQPRTPAWSMCPLRRCRRGERNAIRASAAPGLAAFDRRVSGDDSNAAAFNAPAASSRADRHCSVRRDSWLSSAGHSP
jgi:hypothetical protein